MKLSLRTQLTLWFGLAIVVIMVSTVLVAQQATVWNIERSLDDALQKRANMVAAVISSDITTDEASYVQVMSELAKQDFPFVPLYMRIISPRGKPIVDFGRVPEAIVEELDGLLRIPDITDGRFDSLVPEGVEPLRIYTISVAHPRTHETLAFVQAVESLAQVNQARERLWRNGIIAGMAGGLLAIATGLVVIRRGFRPLRAILKTIDEVDYAHLATRLTHETRPAELEQLAKSLTAMWQRLDVAVSEKQRSLGSVSHDLRTPLTALQGQLEVLLLKPALSPEVRGSLDRMLNETRRLVRMVRNMLLNVQLESRPAPGNEKVDLRELVDEVVGDIWTLAKGHNLKVITPLSATVRADHDLLKQMLVNIVDNAIKFTPKGGRIELKLGAENGWALMAVNDTGRGIPVEELPHVTEAFYTRPTSRRAPGEGARLGLAIVRQITELHGGQLEIQSSVNNGTAVRVHLPLA